MPKGAAINQKSEAMAMCLSPCVCKTPMGSSMVPVPYMISYNFGSTKNVSKDVNFEGAPAVRKDGYLPTVIGNEAGVGGGVMSGVNRGYVNMSEASSTVYVNSVPIVRHGDMVEMNCASPNTDQGKPAATRASDHELCYKCRKELAEKAQQTGDPEIQQAANNLRRQQMDLEYAKLADNVYSPDKDGNHVPPPEGWTEMSDERLYEEYGLESGELSPEDSEFRSRMYAPDPDIFGGDFTNTLAFKGTTSPADWKNNITQGIGMESDYYKRAVEIGRQLKKQGVNVVITGHSLGGGLASAASRSSGYGGATFNAAGLHKNTVGKYGGTLTNSYIRAYQVEGEILTEAQENKVSGSQAAASLGPKVLAGKLIVRALAPNAVGEKYPLPGTGINPVDRHLMPQVIAGLKENLKKNQDLLEKKLGHECETCK